MKSSRKFKQTSSDRIARLKVFLNLKIACHAIPGGQIAQDTKTISWAPTSSLRLQRHVVIGSVCSLLIKTHVAMFSLSFMTNVPFMTHFKESRDSALIDKPLGPLGIRILTVAEFVKLDAGLEAFNHPYIFDSKLIFFYNTNYFDKIKYIWSVIENLFGSLPILNLLCSFGAGRQIMMT